MSRKGRRRLFEWGLAMAAVGLFIVILGGAITAGGITGRGPDPYPTASEPDIETVTSFVGLAIVLLVRSGGVERWLSLPDKRPRRKRPQ